MYQKSDQARKYHNDVNTVNLSSNKAIKAGYKEIFIHKPATDQSTP
jgi:hypothetical protein